jgi:hypothetical protein
MPSRKIYCCRHQRRGMHCHHSPCHHGKSLNPDTLLARIILGLSVVLSGLVRISALVLTFLPPTLRIPISWIFHPLLPRQDCLLLPLATSSSCFHFCSFLSPLLLILSCFFPSDSALFFLSATYSSSFSFCSFMSPSCMTLSHSFFSPFFSLTASSATILFTPSLSSSASPFVLPRPPSPFCHFFSSMTKSLL